MLLQLLLGALLGCLAGVGVWKIGLCQYNIRVDDKKYALFRAAL